MNPQITKLYEIAQKKERIIIGLMSGTSLDGLDIALCKISGNGLNTEVEVLDFETINYDAEFKNQLKEICFKRNTDLELLSLMNVKIAKTHADLIQQFLQKHHKSAQEIDLIASHGQTVFHSPSRLRKPDDFENATLQLGDGDQIAVKAGIITVSDFRQKNIAEGKEGAPLAIFGDYLLFNHSEENRILLNIGGISNFSFIPAKRGFHQVLSSDVGPGNTLMDQFFFREKGLYFDEDSAFAQQGKVNEKLLEILLSHPFFDEDFPKTTGPELFNLDYLDKAIQNCSETIAAYDVMATLNFFTASAIANAVKKISSQVLKTNIYISGGGIHNLLLMQNLESLLPNFQFQDFKNLGFHPDAKEAVLFAVLANETVAGDYADFNPETLSLGKISFPK